MERRRFFLGLLAVAAMAAAPAEAAPKWDLQRGPNEPRRRWWPPRQPNRWRPGAKDPPYGGPAWDYGSTVPPRPPPRCGFWRC